MMEFLAILAALLLGLLWLGGGGFFLGQAWHYGVEPHLPDKKAWFFLSVGILWITMPLAAVIAMGN